jgi:hypothetical protein
LLGFERAIWVRKKVLKSIDHRSPLCLNSTEPIVAWVLKMTDDAFYTLIVLMVGSFVIFLCAVWFIEQRGKRRRKAKRERRKFKL